MTIHDPSLRAALKTLKLTGMLDTLDARLAQTRDGKLGHLEFLQVLCEDEIARRGGDIRFVKCSRMLADLAGGHADRTIGQRMREYTRPLVLIVDDFAMREHTPTQSDDLYDLVSDRAIAAKPLILTSNRAPKDWYPLFPNPVVAESLLDRLINTSHQILMDGPSYRPRKRPGAAAT